MKLTDNEKLRLVMGKNDWFTDDLDGKLYAPRVSDATVGVRCPVDPFDQSKGVTKSVAYPSVQMLSHTWNTDIAYKMGKAVANDCIDNNVDVLLGPGVNIKRIPICGRNFEYFSEDPLLAGILAREYVKGVQDEHIGACVKHFCCNNIEFARLWLSSNVKEKVLREIYLKPFEIAMEAKPYSVMCSYNLVNNIRMSEHKELYDILYNEFGFDGLIMSDWGAVKNPAPSINAGLALIMPHNEDYVKIMQDQLASGLIDRKALDKCVDTVLSFVNKCKEDNKIRKISLTLDERKEICNEVCKEGIVLLKNDDVLPLKGNEKICLTGAPDFMYYCGGGSSRVEANIPYKSLHESLDNVGIKTTVIGTTGWPLGNKYSMDNLPHFIDTLKQSDVGIILVGDPEQCELEGHDRERIRLSPEEEKLIQFSLETGKKIVLVIYAGSAIDISAVVSKLSAILYVGYPGQDGNTVIANVLKGNINPSGKLTETFPLKLEDVKAMHTKFDVYGIDYDEGLYVGYRYFNTYNVPVLYPFGFGLSYSSFTYENLDITDKDDCFVVSFDVLNTSNVDGKETAQVYLRLENNKDRPVRELKGFTKKLVKANNKERYEVIVRKKDLYFYDNKLNKDSFLNHSFYIEVGKNVNDIVLSKLIKK